MGVQAALATVFGDIWSSSRCLALWPWPALIYGYPHTKITGMDYRLFTSLIMPGDFLLTGVRKYKFSNLAINGMFTHLAVCTGSVQGSYEKSTESIFRPKSLFKKNKRSLADLDVNPQNGIFKRSITHAVSEGVLCQDLLDIWYHYDYICAVRPWTCEQDQEVIVNTALSQVGKPYDFEFCKHNQTALFCTELGLICAQKAGLITPALSLKRASIFKPWHKISVPLADFFSCYPAICATRSCFESSILGKALNGTFMRERLVKAAAL